MVVYSYLTVLAVVLLLLLLLLWLLLLPLLPPPLLLLIAVVVQVVLECHTLVHLPASESSKRCTKRSSRLPKLFIAATGATATTSSGSYIEV